MTANTVLITTGRHHGIDRDYTRKFSFNVPLVGNWNRYKVSGWAQNPYQTPESSEYFLVKNESAANKDAIDVPAAATLRQRPAAIDEIPEGDFEFHFIKILKKSYHKQVVFSDNDPESNFNIYSEFNEHLVDAFTSKIPFFLRDAPVEEAEDIAYEHCYNDFTEELDQLSHNATGSRARNTKYMDILNKPVHVDRIGSISFLSKEICERILKTGGATQKYKCIVVNNKLCRGTDELSIDIKELTPVQIRKKTVLFPYLKEWEAYNSQTNTFEKAYVFCLGLNLELSKLVKYKKAFKLFTDLITRLCSSSSDAVLDPAKWEEARDKINRKFYKYWRGIDKLHSNVGQAVCYRTFTSAITAFKTPVEAGEKQPQRTDFTRTIKASFS